MVHLTAVSRLHCDDLKVLALVIAPIPKILFIPVPDKLLFSLFHDLVIAIYVNSIPIVERLKKVVSF